MRIVHNSDELIVDVDSDDIRIATPHIIFEGTYQECLVEIEKKNLLIRARGTTDSNFKARAKKGKK